MHGRSFSSAMRLPLLIAASVVALSFASLALPDAEARWLYCTNVKGPCSGLVCYDSNLNGRYDYGDSCMYTHCPMGGCCWGAPCPPPQE